MNLTCKILHLEDNDDDSFLFQRVLGKLQFVGVYRRVTNADLAFEYFAGQGDFQNRLQFPLPDVVVVDQCVPGRRTAGELAIWLQQSETFSQVPIVVLTGAMSLGEQQKWLANGVALVLFKGGSLPELAFSVGEILDRFPRA